MTTEEQKLYDDLLAEKEQLEKNIETLSTGNATLTADIEKLKNVELKVALETVENQKKTMATSAQLVTTLQQENARLVMSAEQPEISEEDLFKGIGRKR